MMNTHIYDYEFKITFFLSIIHCVFIPEMSFCEFHASTSGLEKLSGKILIDLESFTGETLAVSFYGEWNVRHVYRV